VDLTTLFGGIWVRLAAAVLGAAIVFGGGVYVGRRWDAVALADVRAEQANQAAANATGALNKLTAYITAMQSASANYTGTRDQLFAKLDSIKKEFHDAVKPAPLPPDCRPDAARVRALSQAVAATNAAADPEASRGFGETVRTSP